MKYQKILNIAKISLPSELQYSMKTRYLMLLMCCCFGPLLAQNSEQVVVSTLAEVRANGDIFVDENGDLYISDFGNPSFGNGSTVVKITAAGDASIFASGLTAAPSGITKRDNGDLYVATFNGGDVYRITPNGSQSTVISGLSGPVGLATDDNDNLYAVECRTNRVSQLVNGSSVTIANIPGLGCANGIIWGHDNALYVLMWRDGNIFRVDLAGNATLFATVPGAASHIEYYEGHYYVSGRTSHKVYRVDQNGVVETFAGTGTDGNQDGTVDVATISRPNGIGVDPNDGAIYVTGSSDFSLNNIPIRKIALQSITSGGNDFQINHGLSGSWFDPSQDGQGVVFDFALTDDRFDAVMFWFTYDDTVADEDTELTGFGSRQNRWFTAIGPVQGSSVMMPIYRSAGGVFNDPAMVSTTAVGTVEVEFLSCFEALLSYEFLEPEEKSGTIPLQRVTPDIMCDPLLELP